MRKWYNWLGLHKPGDHWRLWDCPLVGWPIYQSRLMTPTQTLFGDEFYELFVERLVQSRLNDKNYEGWYP